MRRVLGVAVFSGMLGVTLFGIFLTPVFFYVIEGFIESPLFSSPRARLVGKVSLYVVGVLTMGIPFLLILLLGMALRRRKPAPEGQAPHPVLVSLSVGGGDGSQPGHDNGRNGAAHAGSSPELNGVKSQAGQADLH
jgi:hypothetical protein